MSQIRIIDFAKEQKIKEIVDALRSLTFERVELIWAVIIMDQAGKTIESIEAPDAG